MRPPAHDEFRGPARTGRYAAGRGTCGLDATDEVRCGGLFGEVGFEQRPFDDDARRDRAGSGDSEKQRRLAMKAKKIIIFGIGDFARLAHYYFRHDSPHEIVAHTLSADRIETETFLDVPVVPFEGIERRYPPGEFSMDEILDLARRHSLLVIEDAAQGISSTYRGRPLGSIGHLATLSFHETKNVISGEGGALLVNDDRFVERAEIIREKGTDRARFFRGQVDKYTWQDIGSSFLPSELIAAFLAAQLEAVDDILDKRMTIQS